MKRLRRKPCYPIRLQLVHTDRSFTAAKVDFLEAMGKSGCH